MKHAFLIIAYQHHDQLRVLLQLLDHQDCDIKCTFKKPKTPKNRRKKVGGGGGREKGGGGEKN